MGISRRLRLKVLIPLAMVRVNQTRVDFYREKIYLLEEENLSLEWVRQLKFSQACCLAHA
jgi:hypothetical protein